MNLNKLSTQFSISIFIICLSFLLNPTNAAAQQTKWIKVGMLHNWYMESGCEPEVARRGLVSDQLDGLRWPALFKWQDCQAAKALWIGTLNYDDVFGNSYLHKVVHVGPRVWDNERESIPQEFKMIGRFDHPAVFVDGEPASDLDFDDVVEEIDESIKPDRIIYNVVNTSIGITMTRKIMAFSQQYHDNYHIYDYVFKNTGIVDKQGAMHPRRLEGVYFHFQYRYAASREMSSYGLFHMPQSATWGHNTMNDTRGEDPAAGDPFRAQFSWHGRHSGAGFDNIGAPFSIGDGHFTASQFMGVVTLHADTSPTDQSDDPFQPTTTNYLGSDEEITQANSQFNPAKMTKEYEHMASGHPTQRHADAVGNGNADEFLGTPGGFSHTQSFGPYTLEVGDSIHLVLAEGVAGLSRDMNFEIGAEWLNGSAPYSLPSGGTTNNADDFKNAWVFTGRDSLFQTFNRAIDNFNSSLEVPQPPPPPELFEVNSGGDRISLTWADNAESWPGFRGYNVYRAVQIPDTTYDLLATLPPGATSYDDTSAVRGFDYYYYVTTFDDGSSNTSALNPSGPLESSLFWTKTNRPANLKRQAGNSLAAIRVVPNPFNLRATELQYGSAARDRILFLDIPAFCRITIYTERGDLIQTIEHTDGSGDEAWDSVTSSRQIVVSGVYIAHFEVTDDFMDPATGELLYRTGETAIRKFVIIR